MQSAQSRFRALFSWGVVFVFLASCAQFQTRHRTKGEKEKVAEKESSQVTSKDLGSDDFGTEEAPPSEKESSGEAPSGVTGSGLRMPKVAFVLGPGGVRTFAHAGVIKEFIKARVPVDAVVGLEWGALVGALYAQKGQIHDVEWKLYKMNEEDLPGKGIFSSEYKAESIESLNEFFKRNLEKVKIQELKVNFSCPSLSLWSGSINWQESGQMAAALKKCLPYPPLYTPKGHWMAAAFAVEEAVQYLKKKGFELVIFVNVMDGGSPLSQEQLTREYESALLWQELKRHLGSQKQGSMLEVVTVHTRRFKIDSLKDRQAIMQAGEQAGRKAADRIALKYGF